MKEAMAEMAVHHDRMHHEHAGASEAHASLAKLHMARSGHHSARGDKDSSMHHAQMAEHHSALSKHHARMNDSHGKVAATMREYAHGTLHSGSDKGPVVTSRKQAIAIGLSQARKAGEKVAPPKRSRKGNPKSSGLGKMIEASSY